jgi:hypothetical protein
MLVSQDGVVIRTDVDKISLLGRNTQGVMVMRVGESDKVASIAAFTMVDDALTRAERRAAAIADGTISANGSSHGTRINGTIPLNFDDEDEGDDDVEGAVDELDDNDGDGVEEDIEDE